MRALLKRIPLRLAFVCAAGALGLSIQGANPQPVARACGGPTSDPIVNLQPLQWLTSNWNDPEDLRYFGVSEQLSWTYPFFLKHGARAQVLRELDSETPPTIASEGAFRSALDTLARQAAARKVVEDVDWTTTTGRT